MVRNLINGLQNWQLGLYITLTSGAITLPITGRGPPCSIFTIDPVWCLYNGNCIANSRLKLLKFPSELAANPKMEVWFRRYSLLIGSSSWDHVMLAGVSSHTDNDDNHHHRHHCPVSNICFFLSVYIYIYNYTHIVEPHLFSTSTPTHPFFLWCFL